MPMPIDLSTLLAQMPHAAKMQNAVNAHPEAQQAVLGQRVAELRKREGRKIEQVNKKQGSSSVHKDRNPHEKRGLELSGRKKRDKGSEDEEQDSSAPSPWSGNIINLEI